MKIFLKAKHWQLFILLVGLPIISYIVFIVSVIINAFSNFDAMGPMGPMETTMFRYMSWYYVAILIFMALYYAWCWSMGVGQWVLGYINISPKM